MLAMRSQTVYVVGIGQKSAIYLVQDVAIETIARWSGLFLCANVLNDKGAFKSLPWRLSSNSK